MRVSYFDTQSRSKSRGLLSPLLWANDSLLKACVVVTDCEELLCNDASGKY